jgi:hypothetical protein
MSINLSKELEDRINLSKKEASIVIDKIGLNNQKAQVILALDISGSMSSLLSSGKVQRAIERILPLALNFDDDGSVEFFPYHHGGFEHPNPITLENIENFVQKEVLSKYQLGMTNYEPVISLIRKKLGKDPQKSHAVSSTSSGGFLGFGKKTEKEFGTASKGVAANQPAYVLFLTDGDNGDHAKTEDALREASNEEIFWQFVGIGTTGFAFLEKLDNLSGRFIDNASFFQVNDLDAINDNELYSRLLHEFPQWLKLARDKNIIK